ncbi:MULTISPECIES: VIT family protein [unclassified Rhizobium]|uniref:VIT1/CCC1 transporter family protein n=1 Tax=unclassified Rhizobium TaxID=2613769 RepID=UPI0037F62267
MDSAQTEQHFIIRVGWLRAAVLGANDGILSTASLMVGVASAATSSSTVLMTGVAGLVAGAMSMAAGEYVSVSSQADSERADLARERRELATNHDAEVKELAAIYVTRGVEPALSIEVAEQLMAKDALAAHARDELGISDTISANPIQAAMTSAATFSSGGILPVLAALVAPRDILVPAVFGVSLAVLALLGAIGAKAGGAAILKPTLRVAFWGAIAMAVTAGVGGLMGNHRVMEL